MAELSPSPVPGYRLMLSPHIALPTCGSQSPSDVPGGSRVRQISREAGRQGLESVPGCVMPWCGAHPLSAPHAPSIKGVRIGPLVQTLSPGMEGSCI